MRNRILSVLLVLAMVMLPIFSVAESATVSSKDTLTIRLAADPNGFCPYTSGYSISVMLVNRSVYEALVKKDNAGNIMPSLATDWKVADDGMSIHFTLRQGVTFQNGDPFTAEDVVYSFKVLKTERNVTENIFDFQNMTADSEYEVTIPLFAPAGDALARLCAVDYSISSKRAMDEAGEGWLWKPLGTGPYTLKYYRPGDEFCLEANPNYWGEKARIKTVVARIIPENSQAAIELELGNIDLLMGPDTSDIKRAQSGDTPGVAVFEWSEGNVNNIFFNFEKEWTKNKDVRMAISYAINRDDIVKAVFGGLAYKANQPMSRIYGDAYISEYDENPVFDYNPEKAKECLAAAGYKPGELKLVAVVDQDATNVAMLQLIKKNLEDVGIGLDIRSYDSATTIGILLKGDEDDIHMNLTMTGNGYPIEYLKFSNPDYNPNWDNAAFCGLFDDVYPCYQKALASTSREDCFAAVKEGVRIETEEALFVPVTESMAQFLYADTLHIEGFENGRDFDISQFWFE